MSNPNGRRKFVLQLAQAAAWLLSWGSALATSQVPRIKNNQDVSSTPAKLANVRQFGAVADGETNDTPSFKAAIDTLVASGMGGALYVPTGTYVVGDLLLPSNIEMFGDGAGSVIKQFKKSAYLVSINSGTGGSADITQNTRRIRIRHLHFWGDVEKRGFDEHIHLLNVNACTDLVVTDCTFSGFCGDGIYIGSGNKSGLERHNVDIVIRNCTFDGSNGNNRNAISVVDCTGLIIEGCQFRRCSRPNMPGPIDIEPNAHPFHRIQNIAIRNNQFKECSGGVGTICVFFPVRTYQQPPRGIIIEGNKIDGGGRTNGISLRMEGSAKLTDPPLDIQLRGNLVLNTIHPISINGLNGVFAFSNDFQDSTKPGLISHPSHGVAVNVGLIGNRWVQIGKRADAGLRIFAGQNVIITNNVFSDCGVSIGPGGGAINAIGAEHILASAKNNEFNNTAERSRYAVRIGANVPQSHTAAWIAHNRFSNNVIAVFPLGK